MSLTETDRKLIIRNRIKNNKIFMKNILHGNGGKVKILKNFSEYEIKELRKININISYKEYTDQEILDLSKCIYEKGYVDMNITYKKAEIYKTISDRLKIFLKIDIEKVSKYTRDEFVNDCYISTNLMHDVVWNDPNRINTYRKNNGKNLLSNEEYEKYKEIKIKNEVKYKKYMDFLKDKYGNNIDIIHEYYSLT